MDRYRHATCTAFHSRVSIRLDWSRKSDRTGASHVILRGGPLPSRLIQNSICYKRAEEEPSDGRYGSRGRLSVSRKKKNRKEKKGTRGDELMLLPAGSKLVHVRYRSPSPPPTRLANNEVDARWKINPGFRRINLLILGFDCRPNDSRSPRREPISRIRSRHYSVFLFFSLHPSRVPFPKRIFSSSASIRFDL